MREREKGESERSDMREGEKEREKKTILILRGKKRNNIILVATCYSKLVLVHRSKLVKDLGLAPLMLDVFGFLEC